MYNILDKFNEKLSNIAYFLTKTQFKPYYTRKNSLKEGTWK